MNPVLPIAGPIARLGRLADAAGLACAAWALRIVLPAMARARMRGDAGAAERWRRRADRIVMRACILTSRTPSN
ncbi:hypothetical protein [Methylobacterium nigriterrae]|uniref:hypothetical protein n=1 Tax=Methylobacterium nigriterrae TaxID=3127512 RepID=UPI003013813C